MALEYGRHGVRCNAVCPGFVETPMAYQLFDKMSEAELSYYKNSVPLGRFARAEEVAAVVSHLTSSEAEYQQTGCFTRSTAGQQPDTTRAQPGRMSGLSSNEVPQ